MVAGHSNEGAGFARVAAVALGAEGALLARVGTVARSTLGVGICLIGATITALGLVLQKYSHVYNEDHGEDLVYYKQWRWIVGFCCFMGGQIINVVAMAFAPQVMLSCIGSWSLVCNSIFAHTLLGEDLTRRDTACIFAMICGAVLVIMGTPIPDREAVSSDIHALFYNFLQPLFLAVTLCIMAILSLGTVCVKLRDRLSYEHGEKLRRIAPIFWALCTAVMSGYTVLMFKCISMSIDDDGLVKVLYKWPFWIIVLTAALLGWAQIYILNLGLQGGEASVVVPSFYSLGMFSQIGTGALFFNELQFTSLPQGMAFCTGVCMSLLAIIYMTSDQMGEAGEMKPLLEDGESASGPMKSRVRKVTVDSGEESEDTRLGRVVRAQTMPALETPFSPLASARLRLGRTLSLDPEEFRTSYAGKERTYTVALTGFGIV